MRHGVQVRINSVENTGTQVLVNITLQETRDHAADLQASTLMQPISSTGQAVPFLQYSRGDKAQTDPTIHLEANDQFSATLFYQPAPEGALELKFPTVQESIGVLFRAGGFLAGGLKVSATGF